MREGRRENAEVDFLIQQEGRILPVEVKSGAAGSLRSLHLYCEQKSCNYAVRLDLNLPSRQRIQMKNANYELESLPVYAAGCLGE